jgi:hypothetical protein
MYLVESPPTVNGIALLEQLIQAAIEIAENLAVADEKARLELLDGLAIAQLNAMRLVEER